MKVGGFVPLRVAISWVYARDKGFSAHIERYSIWPIDEALQNYNEARRQQISPVVGSVEDAWKLLTAAVVKEQLKMKGRMAVASGIQLFRFTGLENIPFDQDCHLEMETPDTIYSGRPSYRKSWSHVVVDGAVLSLFKKDRTSAAGNPRSRKDQLIAAAVTALWPDGSWIELSDLALVVAINEWIRQNREAYKDHITNIVSPTKIYRYFKPLRLPAPKRRKKTE